MANVAVFAPAGTVTLAGIVAAALVVVKVRVELTALVTVSTALCTPLYVAEIVTPVGDATPDVLTVNVPLVEPPAIVMEAGTVAIAVLFDDRVTTAPDAGAFDASVT